VIADHIGSTGQCILAGSFSVCSMGARQLRAWCEQLKLYPVSHSVSRGLSSSGSKDRFELRAIHTLGSHLVNCIHYCKSPLAGEIWRREKFTLALTFAVQERRFHTKLCVKLYLISCAKYLSTYPDYVGAFFYGNLVRIGHAHG
jgi:hypothetical protein